jgi:hypothetical protein
MFKNEQLKSHFQESSTISSEAFIVAEWNMNLPENIDKVGCYKYRKFDTNQQLIVAGFETVPNKYKTIPNTFDSTNLANHYYQQQVSSTYADTGPGSFLSRYNYTLIEQYSLNECLTMFRPRSGINKARYKTNSYLPNFDKNMFQRPRYYIGSKNDKFKYWTSWRKEYFIERGIANITIDRGYNYIDDAAPFVVYNDPVPANRIVIKMQTNVGTYDSGDTLYSDEVRSDPFYGEENRTVPVLWKVQYLQENNWIDAYSFDENSLIYDNGYLVGPDGYVELQYGLQIPNDFIDRFVFNGTYSSFSQLPEDNYDGAAYLVISNENEKGIMYVWSTSLKTYQPFAPEYEWRPVYRSKEQTEEIPNENFLVTDLINPDYYIDSASRNKVYREFSYIRGIRVIVETMNKKDSSFDLIEMSPRLLVNMSDKTLDYNIKKSLGDLGTTSLPVGQLLASTGSMTIFDEDQSFNMNNSDSLISQYVEKTIKFSFYEKIRYVDGNNVHYVPIKSLYSEGFPQADATGYTVNISLRDMFFHLESMPAPQLLVTDASLSYAVATVLDYIGFSNYIFLRNEDEEEITIPYFFVSPDQNVIDVLNELAVATQSAMFFDEYNNFVVMSKNYLMPSVDEREIDFILSGNNAQNDTGIVENETTGTLPNILSISSQDKKIYNDGKISYTNRYIQRTYGSLKQANLIDQEQTWVYKPALLWEVSGTDNTKSINEAVSKQSNFVLSAMPLNSDLPVSLPKVVNRELVDNTIDVGENVYYLSRYAGLLYANAEIIEYDAVQFNVSGIGNVWISNNKEYQDYFSRIPFNGKIYPTGLLRIYAVPYYEIVDGKQQMKNGYCKVEGRGRFDTTVSAHYAGLDPYWTSNDNVRGCRMKSEYLFTTALEIELPTTITGPAGVDNVLAKQSSRTGIIRNFNATNYLTEKDLNKLKSTESGTIQSSSLVFTGPSFTSSENPLDFITYINKDLFRGGYYRHFGTRMRIVGQIDNSDEKLQTPIGNSIYYQTTGSDPTKNINITGGSGGIAIMLNPNNNNGYYFELAALSEDNIDSYLKVDPAGNATTSISNMFFYKIKKDSNSTSAIPVKLWSGLSKILVDDGNFAGQYRVYGEDNPTVYDIAVEYQKFGTTLRFYLYVNNKLVGVVDDNDPLDITVSCAMFVRGSSKCMFENIYALASNVAMNGVFTVGEPLAEVFGSQEINATEALTKYSLSGLISSTYLSGLSSQGGRKYDLWYEEFGTIMRECAYFNVRYDKAYPALYAKISPTFNRIKGYTVSGFYANSYGAEFLIFNATDSALSLDETTGNFLRIQGVTFTQDTTAELTVDDYFGFAQDSTSLSTRSGPLLLNTIQSNSGAYSLETLVDNPQIQDIDPNPIKTSRLKYGKHDFSISSQYIQTDTAAKDLMGWIINKTMTPKKSVGVNMFATPILQLGDIVTLNYKNKDEVDMISSSDTRFVVYNIEYSRSNTGPNMIVYLSEV